MQIIILSRILKETGQPRRKSGRGLKESDQDSKHNNLCLVPGCLSLRFLGDSVSQVYHSPGEKQNRQDKWHNENRVERNYLWWPTDWMEYGVWPWLALLRGPKFSQAESPYLPLLPTGSLKCQEPGHGIRATPKSSLLTYFTQGHPKSHFLLEGNSSADRLFLKGHAAAQ